MATLVTQAREVIRISKEELFDDLKASNPAEFGAKVYDDVETISEADGDTSFIEILFETVTT